MMENLDGNAAAGTLEMILPFDMTMAVGICAHCGEHRIMAEAAVYKHGMGTIVRCVNCDAVLIRVADIRGRYWLDMRGLCAMQLQQRR
jgi:hypothetical protein